MKIHADHHKHKYPNHINSDMFPKIGDIFLLWGTLNELLDSAICFFIIPTLLIFIHPIMGLTLLAFFYFYEMLLSEVVLDHNPKINFTGFTLFAWGNYHLLHHKKMTNFSFYITLWDYCMGTANCQTKIIVDNRTGSLEILENYFCAK